MREDVVLENKRKKKKKKKPVCVFPNQLHLHLHQISIRVKMEIVTKINSPIKASSSGHPSPHSIQSPTPPHPSIHLPSLDLTKDVLDLRIILQSTVSVSINRKLLDAVVVDKMTEQEAFNHLYISYQKLKKEHTKLVELQNEYSQKKKRKDRVKPPYTRRQIKPKKKKKAKDDSLALPSSSSSSSSASTKQRIKLLSTPLPLVCVSQTTRQIKSRIERAERRERATSLSFKTHKANFPLDTPPSFFSTLFETEDPPYPKEGDDGDIIKALREMYPPIVDRTPMVIDFTLGDDYSDTDEDDEKNEGNEECKPGGSKGNDTCIESDDDDLDVDFGLRDLPPGGIFDLVNTNNEEGIVGVKKLIKGYADGSRKVPQYYFNCGLSKEQRNQQNMDETGC